MHSGIRILAVALAACIASVSAPSLHAAPVGSTFTWQGELRTSGAPSEGVHDFKVALYAQDTGGSQIDAVEIDDAPVSGGLFSLPLDFTSAPFEAGEQYWLELHVREGGSDGAYTVLQPRQPITAAPYALNALSVRDGSVGSSAIDPSQVQRRVAGSCGVGRMISAIAEDGSVVCEDDAIGAGTISGVQAGTGLTGGGSTGVVTLGVNPTEVQRRVAGTCPADSSMRVISQDGSVVCEPDTDTGLTGRQVIVFETTFGGASGATTFGTGEARCPTGTRVIGGGAYSNCVSAYVSSSYPTEAVNSSGWYGFITKPSTFACGVATATMRVYAICAVER